MIEHNELLEHAQYVGNYYGTPKAYVQQQLQAHKHVILEIEIQGALKIKEQFPQTLSTPVCHGLWKKLTAVKYMITWL